MKRKRKQLAGSNQPDRGQKKNKRFPQWYERRPSRLRLDKRLIRENFQGFKLHEEEETGNLYWIGPLSFKNDFGKTYTFRIRVVYPPNYPNALPKVFDEDQRFPPELDRHILPGHSFCLTLPPRKELDLANEDNIVDFLEVVRGFLEKQVIFDLTGKWAGADEPHGNIAIVKYYLEQVVGTDVHFPGKENLMNFLLHGQKHERNAPCPCGSGKKSKTCHADILFRVRSRLPDFGK